MNTSATIGTDAEPSFDVAILGAGFSGSLVAVHLTRSAAGPGVVLIDKSHSHGAGLAYGAAGHRHLLNVPAGRMSAFPRDPDHFLNWLCERPSEAADFGVPTVDAGSFLPRRLYGRYLRWLVAESERNSGRLRLVDSEALDVEPLPDGSFLIRLAGGTALRAGTVVLAMGNFPSSLPYGLDSSILAGPRYLASPWTPEAHRLLSGPEDVLVLGSGLTALDLLVTLQETKASGRIHVLSRRGLLPQPHRAMHPHGINFSWQPTPKTVRELIHRIRAEIKRAKAHGVDWRAVIDSLRPETQAIWHGFDEGERRRFLRHAKTYWEVARHRAAPDGLELLEKWLGQHRLCVHRGRIRSIAPEGDGVAVVFQNSREPDLTKLHVSAVVNCTGPESDLRKVDAPLIRQLIRRGLIQPDSLGLGVNVTRDGQVLDAGGRVNAALYAMGALRKGLLWETTAVPELRAQAADIADRLLAVWKPAENPLAFPANTGGSAPLHVWAYEI